eukprot:10798877-Karenia_brevis.AAC.1
MLVSPVPEWSDSGMPRLASQSRESPPLLLKTAPLRRPDLGLDHSVPDIAMFDCRRRSASLKEFS